ncbi:MAG: hypothetical protein FJ271_25600 [Planctomycetes bacterium]|nr:hypothetical protein [Planctomycetota bacterium]
MARGYELNSKRNWSMLMRICHPGKPFRFSSSHLFAVAALVFTGGCGLEDYEKRMDEQKAYLQLFDEENELLGPPLDMPVRTIKDAKGIRAESPLAVEFYLRPPKGIASKFKTDDPPFMYEGVPVFRYQDPKGYNVLATTGFVAPEKKDGKPTVKDALKVKEFQQRVRGALADYYQKQTGRVVSWLSPEHETTKPEIRTVPNPRGKPTQLVFQTQELAEQPGKKVGSVFFLYFNSNALQQGAFAYQVPAELADHAVVKRAIQLSVNSYGLGMEAAKKRADYRRMRKM